MTATSVIPITHATVIRGQQAWTRIKATAAEQRQLWRDIGEALRYGRSLHKADRAFALWVNENGFGDIKSSTRSNAMRLAERWSVVTTNLHAELKTYYTNHKGERVEDSRSLDLRSTLLQGPSAWRARLKVAAK